MSRPPTATPRARSAQGLRDMLFDELEDLRAGISNPARAKSVAALAATILQSVSVELEFRRHLGQGEEAAVTLGALAVAVAVPVPVDLDDRPIGDGVMRRRP